MCSWSAKITASGSRNSSKSAGVVLGWGSRLVSFGPDTNSVVFPLGFAVRAAMSFGGIAPGDCQRILKYNQERIPAFVLGLGAVNEAWAANAVAAANFGFPTILDSDIPGLPDPYKSIVIVNIPHDKIAAKALGSARDKNLGLQSPGAGQLWPGF